LTDTDDLYAELKDELGDLISPLFELSQGHLRKYNSFLPVGASMKRTGEVVLQAASNGQDIASSPEILPLLHEALCAGAQAEPTRAIAVCEWVKVTPSGGNQTDAIKVLVEHERGFCAAYYLPCQRRWFRGWQFGQMFVVKAEPEVKPWER
jgi:hypothetical protein